MCRCRLDSAGSWGDLCWGQWRAYELHKAVQFTDNPCDTQPQNTNYTNQTIKGSKSFWNRFNACYGSKVTHLIFSLYSKICGPGSSVGVATDYGLDGPWIESRWRRDFFAHVQTGPGAHPISSTMGTGSYTGANGRSAVLTTNPLLAPRLTSRAIPLLPR
jgi:hypothetical protein